MIHQMRNFVRWLISPCSLQMGRWTFPFIMRQAFFTNKYMNTLRNQFLEEIKTNCVLIRLPKTNSSELLPTLCLPLQASLHESRNSFKYTEQCEKTGARISRDFILHRFMQSNHPHFQMYLQHYTHTWKYRLNQVKCLFNKYVACVK